jgi:hypothetical protein
VPILRPCKNTAAFEALPDNGRLSVDLDALERVLLEEGWEPVVNAAVMLIMKKDVEVSIYKSGKMLLKTRDPVVAKELFAALHPHVEPDAPHDPEMQGLDRLERERPGLADRA